MPRHHRIDYVEIAVTDLDAAQAFYAGAFGWEFTPYGPDYAGIRGEREGTEDGGLRRVSEAPRQGGPLVILYSDDLEATLAAVTERGGTVVEPPFAFPGGRRFEFEDLDGNRLAVWASA